MNQEQHTSQEQNINQVPDVNQAPNTDQEARVQSHPNRLTIILAVVTAMLVAICVLLWGTDDAVVASVAKLFDNRPDLIEIETFETLTTQEITQIDIVVQSAEYEGYTEEKTITDAEEIAQFVASIEASKLVIEDEDAGDDDGTADDVNATTATDSYTFYLAEGDAITVLTPPDCANYESEYVFVLGSWQEIDPVKALSFYECYAASSEAAVIIDTNGLVFYPQEWEAGETELAVESYGIDVSYHQGVIDWEQVAADGVDFALIRVGVRYSISGVLEEDILARYNLQEATKYGIAVGVYFYSTAITEEEVLEEVALTLDVISGYAITYPVVYDCERYNDTENRHSVLTQEERSYLADVYLSAMEAAGYTGMFYASQYELELNNGWETNYLQSKYRIWVAQYPGDENGATPEGVSNYSGRHEMWQYTSAGTVAGIEGGVDRNVAYFSYSELAVPQGDVPEEVQPDYDALAGMEEVSDYITAKELVNVRSSMDITDDSNIIGSIVYGEVVARIGVTGDGWSKVEYNDGVGYVATALITTDVSDLQEQADADAETDGEVDTATESEVDTGTDAEADSDDGFETEFETVNEIVTAKEVTNLRNMPSVTDEASVVMATLVNGDTATRTGVSDEGFSRVEYQGQVLYCVSSYLEVVG